MEYRNLVLIIDQNNNIKSLNDMAINKKLIHFKNKQTFEQEVANNNILDTSIVFIQDTQEIYTHGQYYTCKNWSEGINNLQTQINTLVSGNASTAIESFNEIIAFLENIEDSESLDGIIAGIESQIATKQDIITDLETIRSGASRGATALQSYTETDPVFKASAAASIKSSDITNWNSKTSNTGTITEIKMNGISKGTSGVVDLGTVITSHQDISGKLDSATAADIYLNKTDATNTYATKTELENKQDQNLYFTNIVASSWVSDSTYSDYPYRCDLAYNGVTSSDFAVVVFSLGQANSGNYAPICETKNNIVSIWSSTNSSITIPTITIQQQ